MKIFKHILNIFDTFLKYTLSYFIDPQLKYKSRVKNTLQ